MDGDPPEDTGQASRPRRARAATGRAHGRKTELIKFERLIPVGPWGTSGRARSAEPSALIAEDGRIQLDVASVRLLWGETNPFDGRPQRLPLRLFVEPRGGSHRIILIPAQQALDTVYAYPTGHGGRPVWPVVYILRAAKLLGVLGILGQRLRCPVRRVEVERAGHTDPGVALDLSAAVPEPSLRELRELRAQAAMRAGPPGQRGLEPSLETDVPGPSQAAPHLRKRRR